ncbi:DUF732 domain-containing protein [Actinokineospora fastidiosa]|uniref:DUF732 domain-containing protein n=1 Tax=Actinokineospora fastidiosa TaxID=1816 RepID=A0A918LG16_9PSEU|nr:DUF732 domain-containing protein [Actinokineospora fastidiosa]GGS42307.1 hypothetical protein GCM10010171_41420 [Actinokineospora fastidiosa]
MIIDDELGPESNPRRRARSPLSLSSLALAIGLVGLVSAAVMTGVLIGRQSNPAATSTNHSSSPGLPTHTENMRTSDDRYDPDVYGRPLTPDEFFLEYMSANGYPIPPGAVDSGIRLAKATCDLLEGGLGVEEVIKIQMSSGTTDHAEARLFITASISSYCTKHLKVLPVDWLLER